MSLFGALAGVALGRGCYFPRYQWYKTQYS